jgi:hypothetical protein
VREAAGVTTRLILAADLAATMAQAGIDPTLEGRTLQDAIRSAIADRRGYCSWDVDHAGWVVFLHHPEEQTFHGSTLEEALAWSLVWRMAPEIGIGQFVM